MILEPVGIMIAISFKFGAIYNMKKSHLLTETLKVPFDTAKVEHALRVKKKLYSGKSPYQKIEIFDTFDFGKVLVLDGIFQTSEKDEFVYHEMLCHLPIFYHPNPKKVLIIGGGDGGCLEEILKHPIEKVWMVEIDKKVIEVSKKYLPSISKGVFNSKKAEIIIEDGLKFIKNYKDFFDVVILDLSDPGGPAKDLISLNFYKDVKKSLRAKGLISVQGGCFFYQPELVSIIFRKLKRIFPSVIIHRAPVLLYGLGELSFPVAGNIDLRKIKLKEIEKRFRKLNLDLKYYSPKIHFASAVLPKYLMKELKIK